MVNPILILDAFVSNLKDIPALVAEMDGDADNIVAFKRRFPDFPNLRRFTSEQVGPKVIVSWQGQYGGQTSSMEVWKHSFLMIFLSPVETGDSDTSPWIHRVWRQVVKGHPASAGGLSMDRIQPISSVLCMDVPSIDFSLGDETGIDLPQAQIVFTEQGDE